MQTLKIEAQVGEDGYLHLDVLTNLPAGRVEAILVLPQLTEMQGKETLYDFSDIAGSLQWQGDAVKEQRRLRNEWE